MWAVGMSTTPWARSAPWSYCEPRSASEATTAITIGDDSISDAKLKQTGDYILPRLTAHLNGSAYKHAVGHLPTGTTASTVALGNHTHSGGSITGITPSRALISDTSGQLSTSAVTAAELSYLDGASSSIQTQLDGKAASSHFHNTSAINAGTLGLDRLPTGTTTSTVALGKHTHAATDINTEQLADARIPTLAMSKISGLDAALASKQAVIDLDEGRAMVTDAYGRPAASTATSTEIYRLVGLKSNVQDQLDAKQATITGAASTVATGTLPASQVVVTNSSGKIAYSSVTTAELYQLSNIKTTANIQAQLDNRALLSHTHGFQDLTGVIYQTSTPSTTGNTGKIWLKPIT